MQNRYVGDVGDFGKYGLLRRLTGCSTEGPKLSLGVVWYLVPDEGHNDDGKHISYLRKQEYRACDPDLFDGLNRLLANGRRAVEEIHNSGLFPRSTVFFDRYLGCSHLPTVGPRAREERLAVREEWLGNAVSATADCDIVFLDPDNGFEIKSVPKHNNKASKYVFWNEVNRFRRPGQSLVIYHHLNRTAKAVDQVRVKLEEFSEKLIGEGPVIPVVYRRGSLRVFFVLPADNHREIIVTRLNQMARSEWSSHLEIQGA